MHAIGADQRFGMAWLMFAISLGCHVMDEAAHDFLSIYNPNAKMLQSRFSLPVPTFTFREWIVGLSVAVLVLLVLTRWASRDTHWLHKVAIPLGLMVGIFNGLMHVISSVWFHRMMPGVISAPLIIATGMLLIQAALNSKRPSVPAEPLNS
jgi:hypothetical protein